MYQKHGQKIGFPASAGQCVLRHRSWIQVLDQWTLLLLTNLPANLAKLTPPPKTPFFLEILSGYPCSIYYFIIHIKPSISFSPPNCLSNASLTFNSLLKISDCGYSQRNGGRVTKCESPALKVGTPCPSGPNPGAFIRR